MYFINTTELSTAAEAQRPGGEKEEGNLLNEVHHV
jgi:hypothetical protein